MSGVGPLYPSMLAWVQPANWIRDCSVYSWRAISKLQRVVIRDTRVESEVLVCAYSQSTFVDAA